MSGINRIPVGYLDLVGTQTGGKTPSQANEIVAPVVEMLGFYGQQAAAALAITMNHAAVPSQFTTEVPSDECWHLLSCAVRENQPAGTERSIWCVGVNNLPRSSVSSDTGWIFRLDVKGVTAGANAMFVQRLEQPVFLLPGTQLVCELLDRDAGAARNAFWHIWFNKFRA